MTATTIITAIVVMLAVIILLVALLLLLRDRLLPSADVTITINDDRQLQVPTGNSLISTLAEQQIYLPSACGVKGSCGQCKCRVLSGGGSILPTEVGFFTRRQQQEGWRLGCQVKVREDMQIALPPSILNVKKYECTVVSNRNVATYIKEFKVQLPPGEHMDFVPGAYAQIKIPAYDLDYDKDFDKNDIGELYVPVWEKFNIFSLKCKNDTPTIRAYSMANYPDEGDIITLTVRIATPPFLPKPQVGFQPVPPGIASSYIFSLKPGDKCVMSGPYGEFAPVFDSKREMIWVGGGAGMAPLRAQIMHMLKTLHTRDREMHYFYGARGIDEVFFMEDFLELEKEYPNFHFHLGLDFPDKKADALGVKYSAGFIANVLGDTYLKQHEAPEDVEYYLCGPPMMAKTVLDLLHSLGVEDDMIRFDNFGG